MNQLIQLAVDEHKILCDWLLRHQASIIKIAEHVAERLQAGSTIFWCGNGGSAADAQHMSAELTGRFKRERKALPAIALTTDTSALTAIANDYSYQEVFSRQLEGLGHEGDVLIGLSSSGNSENVLLASQVAKRKGITSIGLLGKDGGTLADAVDYPIVVPSHNTPRIQEMHTLICHSICELVDQQY